MHFQEWCVHDDAQLCVLLFAVLRNSPSAGSTGREEQPSNREAASLLPYGRPPRPKKRKKKEIKNYTCPRKNIKKSHAAESKTIPTDRHGQTATNRARKVVRLFGRSYAGFFKRNFERRVQFVRFPSCGTSMLSADAAAARPVRLDSKRGFHWRSSALLAFGSLDGWFGKSISLSLSPSLPLSLLPLASPHYPLATWLA